MLIALVVSCLLSVLINWIVRSIACRNGWVSSPFSKRDIHRHAVPRLGGIGVFVSFAVVISAAAIFRPALLPHSSLLRLMIPATAIFAVGVWDDVRPLSARVKLALQVVCGAALFGWMRFTPVGQALHNLEFGPIIVLVGTIAWIVLVSNSINLVDGVDGLAGGTTALSLAAVTCISIRTGQLGIAFLAIVLIGSVFGFLKFNVHPATLFLGDSGSLFLGFMISALAITATTSRAPFQAIAVPLAILALPLAETAVSILRRFLGGQMIFAADREHIHHKLLDRGFSQRRVSSVLYLVAAICGLSGLAIALGSYFVVIGSIVALLLALSLGVLALGYVEFDELGDIVRRIWRQRRVVANNVSIRKLAERIRNTQCLGEVGEDLRRTFLELEFDGFEFLISPFLGDVLQCDIRAKATNWGFAVETRETDPACWSMGIDLLSEEHGKLGWVRLARKSERGELLFDANVLVGELRPAISLALERCLSARVADRSRFGNIMRHNSNSLRTAREQLGSGYECRAVSHGESSVVTDGRFCSKYKPRVTLKAPDHDAEQLEPGARRRTPPMGDNRIN